MIDYFKTILRGHFEASLCMLDKCIRECPPEHWESKIANGTFRQVAYHTLFYSDLYPVRALGPSSRPRSTAAVASDRPASRPASD
jgi:hypothetical protein